MKTVPGHGSTIEKTYACHRWTDRHSAVAAAAFICIVFAFFFSPIIRFDGIHYIAPARSLIIDGNLNTYDESFYYIQPGWKDVSKRSVTGKPFVFISYVCAPDYTLRGYRYVIFPIGNTLFWLPPMFIAHRICSSFHSCLPVIACDGFSRPYQITLGLWSFFLGIVGLVLAYRILRVWYDAGISCLACLLGFGLGNLIPFITHDVTFSHVIDFLLINLTMLIFIVLSGQLDTWPYHRKLQASALWGMVIGLAVIVRYQDIVLLLLPIVLFGSSDFRKNNRIRMHLFVFASAFLFATGLQVIYWKILYGSFFISARMMGTGDLPSFNILRPQLIPMFFSRFHGLFNWMPWLLPISLATIISIRRTKRFGWVLVILMSSQLYYMATRSEWWNLGFSVRRVSGWTLFFILGMAELLVLFKSRYYRWFIVLAGTVSMAWGWLFQIHYLMKGNPETILPRLIAGTSPRFHDNLYPVIPSIADWSAALKGLKIWFLRYAWTTPFTALCKDHSPVAALILFLGYLLILAMLFALTVVMFRKKHVSIRNSLATLSACILLFGSWMIISDKQAEIIRFQRIVDGQPSELEQILKISKGNAFLGENSFAEIHQEPVKFKSLSHKLPIRANWLVGFPKESDITKQVVKVAASKQESELHAHTIHLNWEDETSAALPLHPWGEMEYQHKWYHISAKFDGLEAAPDHLCISPPEGSAITVAAYWSMED